MRDRSNDKKVGKNTIVVKIGADFAKYYHYSLIVGALLFAMAYSFINNSEPKQYLYLVSFIPLFRHLWFVYNNREESRLDGQLKIVALSTFLFAILFGYTQESHTFLF